MNSLAARDKPNRNSRKANDLCKRGQSLYVEGRLEEALQQFAQARAIRSLKPDEAIFKLRAEYRLNQQDKALETIEEILEVRPDHKEALKTGGRIANARQDAGRARTFWGRLAEADPTDADGLLQMARISFRDNDLADAVRSGRQLLSLMPGHPEASAIAATASVRLNLEDCGDVLARYFDVDRVKAFGLLQQLSRTSEPQTYAAALLAIRDHLVSDPQIVQIAADAGEYFMVSGLQAEIQSRNLDAAKFYRAMRRLDPDSINAEKGLERLRRYAVIKMREGFRLKQAEQVLEHGRKTVEIDPDCFEAWLTLGRSQFFADDFRDAATCFANCVRLNPEDAWSWVNYGRTLERAGDLSGSLDAYRRVMVLASPANPDYIAESERAMRSLYSKALLAGRDAAAKGDVETAWRHCAVAISIEPENENVVVLKRNLLNNMHARIRELWQAGSADAIDICRRFLDRSPDDAYVLQVFARTLMNNQRFAEARPAWERLARMQPEEGHFRLQIARCCNWLKQRADGIAAAEEALRLDPGQAEAAAILKQLEALPPT